MRILGISNPGFTGVTVATKAIVTDYYSVPHLDHRVAVQQMVSNILRFEPDMLVIGGWSRGYLELVRILNRSRKFPVICVYHSTPFHGTQFGDQIYLQEVEAAVSENDGSIDVLGFVHPSTAKYYRHVKGMKSVFIPHFFKPQKQIIKKRPEFTIGVLGGNSWWKNSEGAITIAKSFARTHAGVKVISNQRYDKPQHEFMNTLNACSVILHLSHLECYSNLIQEAWARGIPALMSPANAGLITSNPLTDGMLIEEFAEMYLLQDGIDPMMLWQRLESIYKFPELHAENVYNFYTQLSKISASYLNETFAQIIQAFRSQDYSEFLPVRERLGAPLVKHQRP